MAKLKIPVAKNTTGLLVTPESAEKTEGPFQCPICSMAVLLRAGDVNRAHFAHKPNAACVLPPGETWEHWAAKHLIQQCVRTEPEAIRLHRTCSTCHDDTLQPLPPGPWRAEVEYTLLNDRRPDVVLLDGTDVPRLAIEVHQTHRVDAVKGRAMQLPWIEVEAADILDIHHKIAQGDGTGIHKLTKRKVTLSVIAGRLCPRNFGRFPLEIGVLNPRTTYFQAKLWVPGSDSIAKRPYAAYG